MMNNPSPTIGRWAAVAFAGLLVASGITLWRLAEPEVRAADAPASLDPEVYAVVGGQPITREEVEASVAGDLLKLEQERHTTLEKGLEGLIADRLATLEAEQRGITVDELFQQEIAAKVAQPTDEEVDAFYEANKAQIRQPKEEIADQIQRYLMQQQQQSVVSEMLEALKKKHAVTSHLEPFRVAVESSGFPTIGPDDAPVTIVEFSDFECPYCGRIVPTLDKVRSAYPGKVRLVFRQFPLVGIHPNAMQAALASLCAHEQNSFWKMHDAMFGEQRALSATQLKEKAAKLELDTEAFDACLDSDKYAEAVQADMEAGSAVGVSATPALFINGRLISGAQPFENIAAVIDDELGRGGDSTH
jgi:protein-disulfide isomerase